MLGHEDQAVGQHGIQDQKAHDEGQCELDGVGARLIIPPSQSGPVAVHHVSPFPSARPATAGLAGPARPARTAPPAPDTLQTASNAVRHGSRNAADPRGSCDTGNTPGREAPPSDRPAGTRGPGPPDRYKNPDRSRTSRRQRPWRETARAETAESGRSLRRSERGPIA